MLTSIELLDRVAEIECATTLKDSRKVPTEFDGVAVCLANWAAIYGPFASLRILRVAVRALLTPVWMPRGQRPQPRRTHAPVGPLQRLSSPQDSTFQPDAPQLRAHRFVAHAGIDPQSADLFQTATRKCSSVQARPARR